METRNRSTRFLANFNRNQPMEPLKRTVTRKFPTSTIDSEQLLLLLECRWNADFEANIVDKIYQDELLGTSFNLHKIVKLEFSQYLENYLWRYYSQATKPSKEYTISIALMINEKCRESISAFDCFVESPAEWSNFFFNVLELTINEKISYIEQNVLITFLSHCINSLEIDIVRAEVLKLTSIRCWQCLGERKRTSLFNENPSMRKLYNKMLKFVEKEGEAAVTKHEFYARALWRLLQRFKKTLDALDSTENTDLDTHAISYIERLALMIVDLEAQLTTRRFVHALVEATQVIVHAQLSEFYLTEPGTLFFKLISLLTFYFKFEIDNSAGEALTISDVSQRHYEFVNRLQVCAFRHLREKCRDFCLLNVGNIDSRSFLDKELAKWSADELYTIAYELDIVPGRADTGDAEMVRANLYLYDAKYLREIIVFHATKPIFHLDKINTQPLYPSEAIIWDKDLVPYEQYNGDGVLPLNRLNMQFLTFHDYLQRNFNLFQLESTYEIRHDLEDVLFRMRPWQHEVDKSVVWGGWARMALPIKSTRIVSVGKPLVGSAAPSEVRLDVAITLPKRIDLRREWEQLRRNDVFFLLTIVPTAAVGTKFDVRQPFNEQFKITAARGCELVGMLNQSSEVIDEIDAASAMRELTGDNRSYRVRVDPNQYLLDTEKNDLYYSFNLLVRRDPKANNFKAVLSTIRQLLNTKTVVPEWLHDVLLGYGELDAAHYTRRTGAAIDTMDFNDTFIDIAHLKSSFPNSTVKCEVAAPKSPFRLTFNALKPQHGADERDTSIVANCRLADPVRKLLGAETRKNAVRFTPAQIEAIKSGMEPGLTMVVGPPGTGKTDVAVQVIANIYHNWPEERTLIITHSNQALNQLFEKIIALDVDERHLLRLGHGEEALETSKDFSRYGRVNYVLAERLGLLKQVTRLKEVLKAVGDVDATCETAGYFYRYTMIRTYDEFMEQVESLTSADVAAAASAGDGGAKENGASVEGAGDAGDSMDVHGAKSLPNDYVAKNFPFRAFFDNADELFRGENLATDLQRAEACWAHIQHIFVKLDEFRAFELLRNGRERSDYLLIREAKVIAMTCTHAALRRRELVELGFCYDNVVMEEAAQILEVETFIPLLLQEPTEGVNRLKRWIMIGDHHQLPPVVQNVALQKYSNLEQSLFARFIRLGVPHVLLDAQGRARAEIAALYNWRYASLGNLPHVLADDEYRRANAGFKFAYQFIDVPDFNGAGETTPSPHFYQNLGEAEYAVALYQYMRILGYPAERITVLTTYNGQRALLHDVLTQRCAKHPLIGMPRAVSTVDKYQGQQNDYVILSLVRTRMVGHLRDVRRLVVAVSRARLGLYVVGRRALFDRCLELTPVFRQFAQRPNLLQIVPSEMYGSERKVDEAPTDEVHEIADTTHMVHFVYALYTANQ